MAVTERDQIAYHAATVERVLEMLNVTPGHGLSRQEVQRRFDQHGPNKLREAKRRTAWQIIIAQFTSMVIIVLAAAGAVAFALQHWAEGFAIAAVVFVNAALGFATEWKATRSMEALQEMGGDRIRVRREGEDLEIDAADLLPGDIIIVEAGDIVPADARLIESNNLRVNEAALTGESVPVQKQTQAVKDDAPPADRTCMLYKGTTITEGSGESVVVRTGMQTELGRISELAESAEKETTPLQKRLDRLARRLAWITLVIAAVIAGVGLLAGQDARRMIETAIALGVAAIPEGLPIVATIALARGMHLMARRNALIKKLPAVETLGATRIIFTDKTGTLTENRMSLRRVSTPAGDFMIDEAGRKVQGDGGLDHPLLRRIVEVGVLCNNAALRDVDNDRRQPETEPEAEQGDPTEAALLRAGLMLNMQRPALLEKKPEEREVPFDADCMMMATYHRSDDELEIAVKGAPARVLEACQTIVADDLEGSRPLNEETRRRWIERSEKLAGEGLRVLAVAAKFADSAAAEPYEKLRFLGLVGLLDPPRENVRQAIDACRAAGIRVIMVTGDQPATAAAIAAQAGVARQNELTVMHGSELADPDAMSEEQRDKVAATAVFARVSPEQKLHLIKLMQNRGATVAMTGDGVNDAPALKKADIGVAMGRRGTDAARQVADMVLLDDAFSSIVAAVRQGRIIFGNIRQSVMFMLCTNVAEVIAVAAASAAGGFSKLPIPLLPLQILYLNVVTDVFPALALGMGKGKPDVMQHKPRPHRESVLTPGHWAAVGGWALLLAACVLTALALACCGLDFDQPQAVTISFLTLAFAKLWFVFNLRSAGSTLVDNEIVKNPYIGGAIVLCVLLLLAAVYVPGIAGLLRTVNPTGPGWLLVLGMSLVPFVFGQLLREIQKAGLEKADVEKYR